MLIFTAADCELKVQSVVRNHNAEPQHTRVVISMNSIITFLRLKQKLTDVNTYLRDFTTMLTVRPDIPLAMNIKAPVFIALHLSSPSKQTARPRIIQYDQRKSFFLNNIN